MNKSLYSPVIFLIIFLLPCSLFAQEELANIKFGEVTVADFDLSKYNFDTTADAVVIADIGSAIMGHNNSTLGPGAFVYKVKRRIKILNENGKKLANKSITLLGQNQISHFHGTSYNLINNEVIKTEIDEKDYHFDNENEFTDVIKFTIPNSKVGTIIEFDYEYTSEYYNYVPSWSFQDEYPVLWSSSEFQHYGIFNYYAIPQSILPFYQVQDKIKEPVTFTDRQKLGSSLWRSWSMKNIPALKEEPLVYNLENYRSRLDFELAYIASYGEERENHQKDWNTFSSFLIEDLRWYKPFFKRHNFYKNIVSPIKGESKLSLAKRIYTHIRDNYVAVTKYSLKPEKLPYVIENQKKGTPTELNLHLVSALRFHNINASPLLLNHRNNGKPISNVPIIRRMSKVICHVSIDGVSYVADPSSRDLKFNSLDLGCYNGIAHIVDKKHSTLNLSADSVKEALQKVTHITLDTNTMKWNFDYTYDYGFYASKAIKKKISKEGKKAVKKSMFKNYNSNAKLKNVTITNNPTDTFLTQAKVQFETPANPNADKIYIQLDIAPSEYADAFKAESRTMPIEFPYVQYNAESTDFVIPQGYTVDEMPKSAEIELEDNMGSYSYIIDKTEDKITLLTILRINKSVFLPTEFNSLKKFFNYIEALKQETIVLSKK